MKKYLTLIILALQLLISGSAIAQTAPEPSKSEGATGKVTQILKDAENEKLDRDGLNSLNIPVDGLVGPGEEDLGYAMLQYMLGGVTIEVYNKLFDKSSSGGPADGVVTGTTLLLAIMSGIGLMMLYTVLFYVVVFGLLFSNVSGKPFGERWSTPHLAIRSILSLSLLQPMARYSGLNGGQVLILGAALLSMGFAGAVFRQINTAMLTAPIVNYNVANLDGLYMQLVDSHMCQASLREYGIIRTTNWNEQEVEYQSTFGLWSTIENLFWSEQADDIDMNEVRASTYCVGPECACGEFTVKMPIVEPIDAAKWDNIQLSDLYGDWITQYMMAEGAIKINDLVMNYLDPENSPLNSINNVILQFTRDTSKSKNIADISSAAEELEDRFKKEYNDNWSKFKSLGYNLFNGKLSVEQINKINEKMADKLSDTGFVTAGFAQFIWMQRQEKLNSVYSNVVDTSFSTRAGPKYEDNEYLEILDIDDTLAETVSYPLKLHQQLITSMSIRSQLPSDFSAIMMAAAKGETEDSYTGVFFNDIGTSLQNILMATPRLGTSTKDTPDPVMEMKMMGDTIFSTLIYGGIAWKIVSKLPVGKALSSGAKTAFKGGSNSLFDSASVLGTALFSAILAVAFAYSFIIPSIPFVMFTIGVAAYFAYLFAVLGGSTVWIASWALPDGHDVFGHGGAGWSLVATLMLKPIFMLIGLVLGIAIIKTMGFYVNSTFLPSMLAMNSGVNPISVIGNMVLYATLMSVLVYKGGSLIFELGELMFSMIGVNDSHSGFFGGAQASQALTGLNTMAANQVANTTKTAVGTMLRMRGNKNQ